MQNFLMQCLRETVHTTDVLGFLQSNNAPYDAQRTGIESALVDQHRRLAEINATIQQTRQTLLNLLRERIHVQRRIGDYKYVLNPIRLIPKEVLCEIFQCLVNEDLEKDEDQSSYNPTYPLWALPHVSKQWRDVSLNLPRLWSTVRANLTQPVQPRQEGLWQPIPVVPNPKAPFVLGMQLSRSKQHGLSVSIYSKDSKFSSTDPILLTLLPTANRWKNLLIWLPLEAYTALSPFMTSFPDLKSLHLYALNLADNEAYKITQSPLSTMFKFGCPNLKTIALDPLHLPHLQLPYSQITNFDAFASVSNSQTCLHTLRHLPNLRYFRMCCNDTGDTAPTVEGGQVLVLPNMTDLVLHRNLSGPIHLLKCITPTSLKTLSISGLHRGGVGYLVSFLQRIAGGRGLIFFEFSSVGLRDVDCIRILEGLPPSLTFLTIDCYESFTDKFVKRFGVESAKKARLLPKLEVLTISYGHEEGEPLVIMLKELRPGIKVVRKGTN